MDDACISSRYSRRIDPEDSRMHLRSTDCSHTRAHTREARGRDVYGKSARTRARLLTRTRVHSHRRTRTNMRSGGERCTNASCNSRWLRKLSGRRRLGRAGNNSSSSSGGLGRRSRCSECLRFNATFNARPLKLPSFDVEREDARDSV